MLVLVLVLVVVVKRRIWKNASPPSPGPYFSSYCKHTPLSIVTSLRPPSIDGHIAPSPHFTSSQNFLNSFCKLLKGISYTGPLSHQNTSAIFPPFAFLPSSTLPMKLCESASLLVLIFMMDSQSDTVVVPH